MSKYEFKTNLEGIAEDEIIALAKEGRDLFDSEGIVPRNSPQSFALAALIRLGKPERAARYGRSGYRRSPDDEQQAA